MRYTILLLFDVVLFYQESASAVIHNHLLEAFLL
jgi:hypothetical protein